MTRAADITADGFNESIARLSENLSDQSWKELDAFLLEAKDWEKCD